MCIRDSSNTILYFKALADFSPFAEFKELGNTPEGRKIYCLIVSKEKNFEPVPLDERKKPLLLILNGIHSGEIEGKDASMLLLREILIEKSKEKLLDYADLLIIPVFNVDGHERGAPGSSIANPRINQIGPENMGWRSTSQNFNLNRDWLKSEAPEMSILLKLYSTWLPDFMIDNHTTNGADYQYTVTYGVERHGNIDEKLGTFVNNVFLPYLINSVEKSGYLVAPYVSFKDRTPESGLVDWASQPRFSGGYNAAQNRISLLVEIHMMKPFKERVFSTKAVLESVLNFLGLNGEQILKLNKQADLNAPLKYYMNEQPFYTGFKTADSTNSTFNFKGFKSVKEFSEISGGEKVVYTGEKFEKEIPFYETVVPLDSVILPYAYAIPPQYSYIAEKLKLHGVEVSQLVDSIEFDVSRIKFTNFKFADRPYEGRQRVIQVDYIEFKTVAKLPPGTTIVNVNQRTARIIAFLLEPKSEDSFLRWGFFNHIFEQKEYFEDYVMEKEALRMLEEDDNLTGGTLRKEFETKLKSDTNFANSAYQRLNFFYQKSKYFDSNYMVYPIYKILRNER
ncbi:MAG: M14 family metallopeptidase [Ignavibacteriaceae bacterium]|nr:M14 family metallopeptidase [Ignavibacteriaceae bacterium]